MINKKIMTANEISFAKQYNGYNREQVDRYIENITNAYAEAAMLTARAKQNTEQADESIAQLIDKLHRMMTPKTTDIQPAQSAELETLEEFIASDGDINGRR